MSKHIDEKHLLWHLHAPLCQKVSFFPIIDDETTDDTTYEDPVGMIQVPTNDAENLTLAIKDVLILCMTPLSSCHGSTYDGASSMAEW